MAGVIRSDPFKGAGKLSGRGNVRTTEATKCFPRVKRIAGFSGVPSRSTLAFDVDIVKVGRGWGDEVNTLYAGAHRRMHRCRHRVRFACAAPAEKQPAPPGDDAAEDWVFAARGAQLPPPDLSWKPCSPRMTATHEVNP
jgi:hypothetical protein